MHAILIPYLAVPSLFEKGVMSITPLSLLQTQVSVLPGAGGHFVPVLSATDGTTGTRTNPSNTAQNINIFLVQV